MAVPTGAFELHPPSLRDMLLGGGPRIARDAFGPPLAFYIGWKAVGLVAGIALATVVSLLAYRAARGAGRPGAMARLALVLVVVQAAVGLASGSERVYLAQPVVVNAVLGLVFLVSVAVGRPFAATFADELYAFPDEVRRSETFRKAFARISLAWGVYLCARSVVRLVLLLSSSVEAFLLVNLLTGSPLMALLLAWSIWYAVRFFRRSEEWGDAIRALEQAQL
jgi:intracellular septation protein A